MRGGVMAISILALFDLGGGETILILALLLILFVGERLPEFARGLEIGVKEFLKAADKEAQEAGESLGGIHGKPAAEALTIDNQVAELYDPEALRDQEQTDRFNRGSIFLS